MKWKRITFDADLLQYKTKKSILIRMPCNCDYQGFSFWYPSKIVKEQAGYIDILYTDDFIFKLVCKTYEDTVEKVLTAKEMEDVLGVKDCHCYITEPERYIPKKIAPVKVEVDEDLKDDE